MKLTVAQLKVMSGLLDEALPLDLAARSAWLEALPPEHPELVCAFGHIGDRPFRRNKTLPMCPERTLGFMVVREGLEPSTSAL